MRQVKTNRSVIDILLGFFTCGIYSLFLVHSLAEDVNAMCKGDGKQTAGLASYILLSVLTCGLYSIYWWYAVSDRVSNAAVRRGMKQLNFDGTTFLLWYLVGALLCALGSLVAYHKLFDVCNQVGAVYNNMITSRPTSGVRPPQAGQFYNNTPQ